MSPEVGCSKPAMRRSVVVLPHPDGPSSEKKLPRGMASEISLDRKSTRLNSSHLGISSAVFRLKKKNLPGGPAGRLLPPAAGGPGERRAQVRRHDGGACEGNHRRGDQGGVLLFFF